MTVKDYSHIKLLVERYPALEPCVPSILQSILMVIECYHSENKLLLCGNGGSAADAEHIVGELAKAFVLPRPLSQADKSKLVGIDGDALASHLASNLQRGVSAFALSGSSPLATAIANDGDPSLVYAQMTYVHGKPGDVLIGISTSGNSKNVVAALTVARAFGLKTVGLTGSKFGEMDHLCDSIIKVPATETFKVQEFHLPIYHCICLTVESDLFGDSV